MKSFQEGERQSDVIPNTLYLIGSVLGQRHPPAETQGQATELGASSLDELQRKRDDRQMPDLKTHGKKGEVNK